MTELVHVRAGDIGDFKRGSGFPVRYQGSKAGDLPFYKVSDMNLEGNEIYMRRANNYISEEQRRKLGATRIPAGSIVFAKIGAAVYLERKRILSVDSCIDNNMAAFLVEPKRFNTRYMHYVLSQVRISELAAATSLPSLSNGQLRSLELRVYEDPKEQRDVASALEDADKSISAYQALLTKRLDTKRGLMQALLSGHTRLPGFHEPWAQIRLGDHVTFLRTAALSRAQLDSKSPIRCLHYGDIHTRRSVRLHAATESMTRAAAPLVARAGRLAVGDLVFADASEDESGVGKSLEIQSVPTEGLVAGLHTIAARFDKQMLADGFKAYLQFVPTFRQSLLRLAAGTKVLATTRTYLASIELALPSVAEQAAIARILMDTDSESAALEAQLEKAQLIRQGMMQELLTGRTRLVHEGAI